MFWWFKGWDEMRQYLDTDFPPVQVASGNVGSSAVVLEARFLTLRSGSPFLGPPFHLCYSVRHQSLGPWCPEGGRLAALRDVLDANYQLGKVLKLERT